MALKLCKECGKEVSKKAKKCPHCGVKLKSGFIAKLFMLSFLFFVFIIFVMSSGSEKSKMKAENKLKNATIDTSFDQKALFEMFKSYGSDKSKLNIIQE
jgi:uncharacterized protein YpmS